jgi:sugar lactone lactonase YvrE
MEKEKKERDSLFSDLASDGFVFKEADFASSGFEFKNADFGQIEPLESAKKNSVLPEELKEGSPTSGSKRRIVKPKRALGSPEDKGASPFLNLFHFEKDDKGLNLARTFVPTWKIILYLQEIVTHLDFELYPTDILLEIRKRYHTLSSPVTAENAIVSTLDLKAVQATLKSPSGLFIENENDKGSFKLLVAEYGKHVISRITINNFTQKVAAYEIIAGVPNTMGGVDGQALVALFQQPISLCKDWDDNILVVDCNGHKVRKIDAKTGLVSTFAGSSSGLEDGPALEAKFQHPSDICLFKDNLYIVDSGNSQIRMIDRNELKVKTLTFKSIEHDNNQGLSKPRSLCVDSNGDIFITDFGNSKVKKLSKVNTGSHESKELGEEFEYKLTTVLRAQFKQPYGVCLDNEENLIVSDWSSSNVRKLELAGPKVKHTNIAGKISGFGDGKGSDLENTQFQGPCGIKIDSLGNIYIADYLNHMIRKISNDALVSHVHADKDTSMNSNMAFNFNFNINEDKKRLKFIIEITL